MLFHHTARGIDGCALWSTWEEARVLWDTVLRVAPEPRALFLMGNHLHLLHTHDLRASLGAALGGYARHLHETSGGKGRLFEPVWAEPIADEKKHSRVERYVHLQSCRARMTSCPLEWPFSTHRDAVGLAAWPVRPRAENRFRYHQFVSADPSCGVEGTEWPARQLDMPSAKAVLYATSAVTRTPLSAMSSHGPARTLFVTAARTLSPASAREIGDLCGLTRQQVNRIPRATSAAVGVIEAVWSDPRFAPLGIPPQMFHGKKYLPQNVPDHATEIEFTDSPNDETPVFDDGWT